MYDIHLNFIPRPLLNEITNNNNNDYDDVDDGRSSR